MIKLDYDRLSCCDVTPVQMIVTVPRSFVDLINERTRKGGPSAAEFAGQLLEDAFVTFAEEEMLELRLDPKTLDPGTLQEAYAGNYDQVSLDELSAMIGLSSTFLKDPNIRSSIPGHDYDLHDFKWFWFYREEVVPWLLSEEAKQLHDAHPEHHIATIRADSTRVTG